LDSRISDSLAQPTVAKRPQNGARHDEKKEAEPLADIQGASSDIHPNQITDWKAQLIEHSAQVFGDGPGKAAEPDLKTLHAKIGQLTLENDFLEGALIKAGMLSAKR